MKLMSFTSAEGAIASVPRWRQARYRALLRAATLALRARAPEALSMDDIAEAAGVGKATLYRYFASKQALLRACLAALVEELGARIEAAEQARADPPERLRMIVGAMAVAFSRHLLPLRFLSMRSAELHAEWRESVLDARHRLVRVLCRHFDSGTDAGWYVPVDNGLVPHMIMGMIRSSVAHAPNTSASEITDAVCAFVLRACLLEARQASPVQLRRAAASAAVRR